MGADIAGHTGYPRSMNYIKVTTTQHIHMLMKNEVKVTSTQHNKYVYEE